MIDAIDTKILEELKKDSRKSYSYIADVVGKTEATVRRRVKKMIRKNIITKFTLEYDINNQPQIHATVKVKLNYKNIKNVLKKVKEIKEITNIWRLSDDCGLLIKLKIPSIEDFHPIIEDQLLKIDNIKIIETCFITDIIK